LIWLEELARSYFLLSIQSKCEEFFSIPASIVVGSDSYTASVVALGDEFSGTSIGRALGEYGGSLERWADDADLTYGAPDSMDDDALYYNASLWKIASDQQKEIVARCDDLLTRG